MSIENILREAKLNNTLVSIYIDSDDWGQYSVGYVDLVTNDYVRLRAISKNGEPAGFEIRPLAEIFKVEFGGKYESKIEKIFQSHEKVFNEIQPKKRSPENNLVVDTIQQSLTESIVIVIWGKDPDDSLVGYVEKLESNLVSIRLINEFGEDDGLSTINIDEISSIDFNTQSEQIRSYLYNLNQSQR